METGTVRDDVASHLVLSDGPMESRLRYSPPWCNETLMLGDGLGFERVGLISDAKGTQYPTSLYPAIYFILQRLFQRPCRSPNSLQLAGVHDRSGAYGARLATSH